NVRSWCRHPRIHCRARLQRARFGTGSIGATTTRIRRRSMEDLKGKRVAILVTNGFEQIEMTSPREALERAGAKCTLIAPKAGKVQGVKHHEEADQFDVQMTLDQADASDFDAVLLPGGVINADAIRIEKKAQQFVQEIDRAGKPIAVICHGPWLLVSAGL